MRHIRNNNMSFEVKFFEEGSIYRDVSLSIDGYDQLELENVANRFYAFLAAMGWHDIKDVIIEHTDGRITRGK